MPARPSTFSEHFRSVEFDCHDGSPVPERLYRGFEVWAAWWGEPMRAHFGTVWVTSGYRTVSHNREVGGASSSVHLGKTRMRNVSSGSRIYAVAADVHCESGTVNDWAVWAREARKVNDHLGKRGRGGIGVYVAGGFVHLDTAALRDWRGP